MKVFRNDIPEGQKAFMQYPAIESMMSGIHYASQDRFGIITVVYSDNTEEKRQADFNIEDKTCFEIVSFVQAGR